MTECIYCIKNGNRYIIGSTSRDIYVKLKSLNINRDKKYEILIAKIVNNAKDKCMIINSILGIIEYDYNVIFKLFMLMDGTYVDVEHDEEAALFKFKLSSPMSDHLPKK